MLWTQWAHSCEIVYHSMLLYSRTILAAFCYGILWQIKCRGPLARSVKLRAAHAPGMPGTFSPPPQVSDLDMHHGTCVTARAVMHAGIANPRFPLKAVAGKRSRHSWRMRNPQFCVSGKRPIAIMTEPNQIKFRLPHISPAAHSLPFWNFIKRIN